MNTLLEFSDVWFFWIKIYL